MQGAEGASGSLTIIDIVKQLAQLYHDGDPKWGLIPDNPKEIGQLFYVFTSSASAGDLDRFMDPSRPLRHRSSRCSAATRTTSSRTRSPAAKRFSRRHSSGEVEFKFAGGLFGILAAVNEAVENSYWTNLGADLLHRLLLPVPDLRLAGTPPALLMIPVILSQLAAEALMVLAAHRPERQLAADRRGRRRRRRRLRHLPLQPHDRHATTRSASSTKPSTTPPPRPARRSSSPARR